MNTFDIKLEKIYNHVSDAYMYPKLIRIDNNLILASFYFMKIMSVQYVLEKAIAEKKINSGDTIIESSSGVYAYSLALVCNKLGLQCVIVGSSSIDNNFKRMLELLGAKVFILDTKILSENQKKRVLFLKEYIKHNPKTHWIGQYHNRDHYLGYKILADSLLDAVGKNFTLIASVGSGSSSCGTIEFLREIADIKLIGVEPFGSVSFGLAGDDEIIPGIGTGIHFPNVTHSYYDKIHWVSSKLGKFYTLELYKKTGIFSGHSTGATFCVAKWEAQNNPDKLFVFISPDMGYRYIDGIYNSNESLNVDISEMGPKEVLSAGEAEKPWSYIFWNRKSLQGKIAYEYFDKS